MAGHWNFQYCIVLLYAIGPGDLLCITASTKYATHALGTEGHTDHNSPSDQIIQVLSAMSAWSLIGGFVAVDTCLHLEVADCH